MLGNHANHPHNTVALNDLAFVADLLNTCSNFHDLFFLIEPSVPTSGIPQVYRLETKAHAERR
jgi:hypothetical protein